MSSDIASLVIKVDASGVATADSAMTKATSAAEMLEGMVQKLIVAFGALKLLEAVKDSTLLAARYETLGVVMGVVGNNAGYTRDQMDGFQKALEESGISAIESRNSLNMMASAQLDLTKSSELARAAQDTAVIAGINSSEAFQRMTRAIVSGEVEILKTMGMIVSWEAGYKRLAPTIGKVSSNLTEHEKLLLRQQIVLEEAAKKAGAYEAAMGTAGKQLGSMARIIENLQVVIGNVFLEAFTGLIRDLTGALEIAKKWMDENKTAISELSQAMKGAVTQSEMFAKLMSDLGGGGSGAAKGIVFLTRLTQGLTFFWAGLTDIVRGWATLVFKVLEGVGWSMEKISKSSAMKDWAKSMGSSVGLTGENSALTSWYDSVTSLPASAAPAKKDGKLGTGGGGGAAAPDLKLLHQQEAYVKGLEKEAAQLGLTKSEQDMYTLSLQKLTKAQFDRAIFAISTVAAYEEEQAALKKGQATYEAEQEELQFINKYNHDLIEGRKGAANAIRDSLDPMRAYAKELKAIADLEGQKGGLPALEAGVARAKVWKRQQEEMIKLRIEGSETNKTIAAAWETTTRGMEDAFVRFATTGKASFKEMTSSILADLARMMANKAFAQLLDFGIRSYFGGDVAVSAEDFGTGSLPSGSGGGFSGVAGPSSTTAPMSFSVTQTFTDGKASSDAKSDGGKQGQEIARSLESAMNQWAVKNMRPGGVLNPVGAS